VADDAGIVQQALDVPAGEAGDGVVVEAGEGGAEVLSLGQDGPPAQPGLEALQAQLLEQASGWAVTPRMCTRRVLTSITNNT
jgi:hypothetical protein